jgi:hypothetical protein
MQHPFAGVMGAGQEMTEARPTRRSLLGRMLGVVAALFGTAAAASAQTPGFRGSGNVTTYALGEEGGVITTYALGEEGGGVVTTYALGEEGGYNPPRSRQATTLALGEEGGRRPPPFRQPTPPSRRR